MNNFFATVFATAHNVAQAVLDMAILRPLKTLYFDGPTILGIGFWEKLPQRDICSRLTGVSATFWDKSDAAHECSALVSRKFETFIVGAFTLSYVWVVYKFVSYILFRFFVIQPITKEIKDEIKKVLESTSFHDQGRQRRPSHSSAFFRYKAPPSQAPLDSEEVNGSDKESEGGEGGE